MFLKQLKWALSWTIAGLMFLLLVIWWLSYALIDLSGLIKSWNNPKLSKDDRNTLVRAVEELENNVNNGCELWDSYGGEVITIDDITSSTYLSDEDKDIIFSDIELARSGDEEAIFLLSWYYEIDFLWMGNGWWGFFSDEYQFSSSTTCKIRNCVEWEIDWDENYMFHVPKEYISYCFQSSQPEPEPETPSRSCTYRYSGSYSKWTSYYVYSLNWWGYDNLYYYDKSSKKCNTYSVSCDTNGQWTVNNIHQNNWSDASIVGVIQYIWKNNVRPSCMEACLATYTNYPVQNSPYNEQCSHLTDDR